MKSGAKLLFAEILWTWPFCPSHTNATVCKERNAKTQSVMRAHSTAPTHPEISAVLLCSKLVAVIRDVYTHGRSEATCLCFAPEVKSTTKW